MESESTLTKNWIKIYPSYIDTALKHSEGRKVSAIHSVENPTAPEIYLVCKELFGLECIIERHHHPRDWLKRGRVIVHLKEGKNCLSEISNSKYF